MSQNQNKDRMGKTSEEIEYEKYKNECTFKPNISPYRKEEPPKSLA